MRSGLSVSIIIPAKDEQENIGTLITEIHSALGTEEDYEVIRGR